jgi:23S rRNA (adenine2503-C2)-methyltransferase
MNSIYNYSKDSLDTYFLNLGYTKFRSTQVFEALYKQKITDFSLITNLKKELRDKLSEDFFIPRLKLVKLQESVDETKKYLFELEDGNLIETVLMKHNYGYSICITTQAGCNMGCAFCASGLIKKKRNLETSEMVLQILEVDNYLNKENKRVSHIVLMGIGEPFDNYENVLEFLKIVNDPKGLEIGSRHITISTCGIVPKIYEFAEFPLQVNLAISLHFTNNDKRSKYMKINNAYPLEELFKAVDYYYLRTNRRVTYEYILLDDINDSLEDAKELVNLMKGRNAYVNLIPYNNTNLFSRSTESKMNAFYNYLKKNNINVTLRREQGHDIDAACGQLSLKEIR